MVSGGLLSSTVSSAALRARTEGLLASVVDVSLPECEFVIGLRVGEGEDFCILMIGSCCSAFRLCSFVLAEAI